PAFTLVQRRPVASARMRHCLGGYAIDRDCVLLIDRNAGQSTALRLLRQIGSSHMTLADKKHREALGSGGTQRVFPLSVLRSLAAAKENCNFLLFGTRAAPGRTDRRFKSFGKGFCRRKHIHFGLGGSNRSSAA